MKTSTTAAVIFAALAPGTLAFAGQNQPAMDMSRMPGMQHAAMKQASHVQLTITDNRSLQQLTVRLGPISLPPHSGMNVAQAPDLSWNVPFDGWFTGYLARLQDGSGQRVYARLLHHVAVYDTNRRNFLCPKQPEHIFGAGGELTEWPTLPGLGYRVERGDNILVSTMFHNDSSSDFPQVYLKLIISYRRRAPGGPQLMDVYPAWFDVMECGSSGYDLKPGRNVKTGEFTLDFGGRLIGVGGHMHDYGRELILTDASHRHTIADLKADLDPRGRLISIPIVRFTDSGGLPLAKSDVIQVTSIYENPSGKYLRDGAMGIVVGYFMPDRPADFAALRKPAGGPGKGSK